MSLLGGYPILRQTSPKCSKIGLMKIPTLTSIDLNILNFMEIACARTQECFGTVIVGLCKTGFQGKVQNPVAAL